MASPVDETGMKKLARLRRGDTVLLKRNLQHPANMQLSDLPDPVTKRREWVPDTSLDETIGERVITDIRRGAMPGKAARARVYLLLPNGYWYDTSDGGSQAGSGATYIEPLD